MLYSKPQYRVGAVIHHRLYDYRGVVIAVDHYCKADDEWYENNATRPTRNQPWYHVLVDGGRETYVAEENLELDASGAAVEHPLVPKYFGSFVDGRYHRPSLN